MPKIHPEITPFPLYRAVMHSKRNRISLGERNDLGARLHARPLFDQQKFSTGKVAARVGEQNRDLYRENVLAIEILMQAIEVARTISKQQRRGLQLSCFVAAVKKL